MKVTREDRKELKKVLDNLGRRKRKETVFYDLCFCLCAPQTTFVNNKKVIEDLKVYGAGGKGFYKTKIGLLTEAHLRILCRPVRFYNNKARYLLEAKENFDEIYEKIKKVQKDKDNCGYELREWLVKNVKGLGMKAASHFLRNLGFDALAIIDTHIIKFMADDDNFMPIDALWYTTEEIEDKLRKKVTSIKGYEDIESWFQEMAGKYKMTTAELDALVWKNYSKTEWKEFTF
jgi:N-glycosylase/DNA lyase